MKKLKKETKSKEKKNIGRFNGKKTPAERKHSVLYEDSKEAVIVHKVFFIALMVIFIIVSLFLGIRYLINENFINRYQKEEYADLGENSLFSMNYIESYLPYYNTGNVYYKNGDYENAIGQYKIALEKNPPHKTENDKECDIRVNLALAKISLIDFENLKTDEAIDKAIDKLLSARADLTENGCANPKDDNGHNAEAEKLKKEIDELIKKLREQKKKNNQNQNQGDGDGGGSSDDDSSNQNNNNDNSKSQREKNLQDDLNKERKRAMEEQRKGERDNENSENGGSNDSVFGFGWGDYDDEAETNW